MSTVTSDFNHSSKYYINYTPTNLSAEMMSTHLRMIVKTVVDRIVDLRIQILDQAWNIVQTPIQFFPVNALRKVELWIENSEPHKCFLHLFGKDFLDAFIAETNLLEGKLLLKWHLGSCSWLKTCRSWRTFSIFGK